MTIKKLLAENNINDVVSAEKFIRGEIKNLQRIGDLGLGKD